ncbi:MAG: DUF971 domain-containing protein [Rhizobiales bacterium]|nr:DUF971 domain-containing protein [Hyphomicrobiales bacterium]
MTSAWPTDIRVQQGGTELHVAFDSGEQGTITAELLRVESPSAEVKGHGPGQEQLVWGKSKVKIGKVEAVGNYALRLIFDDGHSTGIYTWPYLMKLMREGDALIAAYDKKVKAAGLSRA